MRITAENLNEFGLVDDVLTEPLGGAHRNPGAVADVIRDALLKHLADVDRFESDELLEQRQRRLAGFGQFKES